MIEAIVFFSLIIWIVYTTYLARKFLLKKSIIDIPNARSNHQDAIPRGGGIGFIDTVLIAWGVVAFLYGEIWMMLPLLLGVALLATISFFDDIKHINAFWRLVFQFIAVAAGLYSLAGQYLFLDWLPVSIAMIVTGLLWMWFINLTNFMDGIDGITCSEIAFINLSVVLLGQFVPLPPQLIFYAIILAAISLGFLVWNWHPAKIFMGDVGSISLGFFTAYILIQLIVEGYWLAALLLPAYYFADSGITLIKRALQKQPIWQAHSEHYYQLAVRTGKSHSQVVKRIMLANLLLGILAIWGTLYQKHIIFILVATSIIVTMLLQLLRRSK